MSIPTENKQYTEQITQAALNAVDQSTLNLSDTNKVTVARHLFETGEAVVKLWRQGTPDTGKGDLYEYMNKVNAIKSSAASEIDKIIHNGEATDELIASFIAGMKLSAKKSPPKQKAHREQQCAAKIPLALITKLVIRARS